MRQKALQKALDALPHMKPVEKPEDYVGIPSINVLKTQTDESVHIIFAESRFDVAMCPHCRKPSEKVHDREFRFIRDLSCFGKPVFIGIHIRRFACRHCDRVFTEKLDFLDRNQRQTRRFQEYVAMFCKHGTVESAAETLNMSWDATNRVFTREAEKGDTLTGGSASRTPRDRRYRS